MLYLAFRFVLCATPCAQEILNYLFQVTGKGQEKHATVEFVQTILRVTFCNMFYIIGRSGSKVHCNSKILKLFPARLLVFSFLLMYGRTPFFVSVGSVFVVSNFLLAWFTLRTKLYKNCFTAFAGRQKILLQLVAFNMAYRANGAQT